MIDGLSISEEEFLALPQKRQMCVLFQNTEELKILIKGYKFWQKLSTIVGSVLIMGIIYLFKLQLGGG